MLKSGKFSHTNATAVYVKESASFRVGGGDSGGPLITISHSNYLLNGILSQSMEDYFDFYALYTHPYYFISWINCSIPSKQRINYQGTLNDQVACDEVPLLKVSELKTFKHKLCEDNLKGFKFVNNDCLPATKEACEKYSANIEPQMQWDAYTGKCL
jgi:hypothetical protein